MNKNIYIFILTTMVFTQTSSLTMYGYGEYIHASDASSIAMGDSKYFSGSPSRMSLSSPSSYWRNSFSNLMMSICYSNTTLSNQNLIENNFRIISFSFPINNNSMLALGMNPLMRSDIKIEENNFSFIGSDQSPTGSALAYNSDYDFSGGMSEFFILYSSKLSQNTSFGLRWSKIFGSSKHKYFLNLYNVTFDQDENIQYSLNNVESFIDNNRYSSNKYLLEFRYTLLNFDTVLSYSRTNPLNVEITPYYDTLGYLDTESYYVDDKLSELGFGLNYILNNDLGIIFEYHILNSFNSYGFLNIYSQDSPDVYSSHLGIYSNIGNALNSSTILKFGIFNKTYDFTDFSLYDHGLTFGLGYNYFETKNHIDIAFKIGQRSTEYSMIEDERYYKLVLSIINGEKWFVNERK